MNVCDQQISISNSDILRTFLWLLYFYVSIIIIDVKYGFETRMLRKMEKKGKWKEENEVIL